MLVLRALGGVVGLIGLGTAGAALLQSPRAIFVAMFEISVIGGGVFAVLLGLNRIVTGRALAMLCIAGALGAATVFGYLSVNGELAGQSLKWWGVGRLGLAGLFVALAAAEVLLREPRESLRRFAIGAALLLPVAGVLGAVATSSVRTMIGNLDALAQVLLALVGFFVLLGLVCAGAHYLITAFVHGVEAAEAREDGGG